MLSSILDNLSDMFCRGKVACIQISPSPHQQDPYKVVVVVMLSSILIKDLVEVASPHGTSDSLTPLGESLFRGIKVMLCGCYVSLLDFFLYFCRVAYGRIVHGRIKYCQKNTSKVQLVTASKEQAQDYYRMDVFMNWHHGSMGYSYFNFFLNFLMQFYQWHEK